MNQLLMDLMLAAMRHPMRTAALLLAVGVALIGAAVLVDRDRP